jgi:protein-disulfide isomerase/uncharacterized membrane protein
MARKSNQPHGNAGKPSAGRAARTPNGASAWAAVLGTIFLASSALMSLLLALEYLGAVKLPGCGEDSPCHQAARSVWGRVPGIAWPTSYVGVAYFLAILAAWLITRAALPSAIRWLARLGVLGSLGFCVIIVVEKLLCMYCLAAHVGNVLFWITFERTKARASRSGPGWAALLGVFLLVTAVLALWDRQVHATSAAAAEANRGQALQQMIDQSRDQKPPQSQPSATTQATGRPTPAPATQPTTAPASRPSTATVPTTVPAAGSGFIGRYPSGPIEAPIRVVLFTGYQCPDCAQIERQVQMLQQNRSDICFSIKHFPFNSDCNPGIKKTQQPNGCWAARAAEAAGLLWGSDGFWKMHHWLFARSGVFETTQQVEDAIRGFGYDPNGFVSVLASEQTLRVVREDAAEAERLGLFFTPMIFINGVELKGWDAPMALVRTVEELAATNPPARPPTADHPPPALDKCIADWREQAVFVLPADTHAWTLGPPDAVHKIVFWGDYQESITAELDGLIRAFVGKRTDVQYTYRHYPFNADCNPNIKERRFPLACRAAQAAEAAGRLAGNDGYWKMHAWLMENQKALSDDTLRAAAGRLSLDADALLTAMDTDDVRQSIIEDTQAGQQLPRLRLGTPPGIHGIPTIFVDGRYVPRARMNDTPVILEILEAAVATNRADR